MGGRVILTADAHCKEHLLFGYDQAAELARAAGFTESAGADRRRGGTLPAGVRET